MSRIDEKINKYFDKQEEVNEVKKGTKKTTAMQIGREVSAVLEQNMKKVEKEIKEVLEEDETMDENSIQKVADNILTTLFRLERDELNLQNVVMKAAKRHLR